MLNCVSPITFQMIQLNMREQSPKDKPNNIDEYISGFPEDIQLILEKMRAEIKSAAPEAEETISYGMPAFQQNGILVYFAVNKHHIGFYPTASPIIAFEKELSPYKHSKGAIQFPIDKPIPFGLVKKIVKFKVKENEAKLGSKNHARLSQKRL